MLSQQRVHVERDRAPRAGSGPAAYGNVAPGRTGRGARLHTSLGLEEESPMLYPSRRARRGLRAWWREHVAGPLDAMYEHLDEYQQGE